MLGLVLLHVGGRPAVGVVECGDELDDGADLQVLLRHQLAAAAGAFVKSLAIEPPIKAGTPDPYTPPAPGQLVPQEHLQIGGSIANDFKNAPAAAAIGWNTQACGKSTLCSSRGSHSKLCKRGML